MHVTSPVSNLNHSYHLSTSSSQFLSSLVLAVALALCLIRLLLLVRAAFRRRLVQIYDPSVPVYTRASYFDHLRQKILVVMMYSTV